MIDINAVADFFLLCPDEGAGDVVTHLKLQKLAYYAQAWHLAIFDEPLVPDHFEAWAHGPVSPKLFSRFTGYSYNPIPKKAVKTRVEDDAIVEHLSEVWEVYGDYTPKALERMTHSEEPWVKARGDLGPLERSSVIITNESMQSFYKTLLDQDGEEQGPTA